MDALRLSTLHHSPLTLRWFPHAVWESSPSALRTGSGPSCGLVVLLRRRVGTGKRWMRFAYPPYTIRHSPFAARHSPLAPRGFGGCASLIHPTPFAIRHSPLATHPQGIWWMRFAYPPYTIRHSPLTTHPYTPHPSPAIFLAAVDKNGICTGEAVSSCPLRFVQGPV